MKELIDSWQLWAGLAACFAALTAIFAKVGVANINSDFATGRMKHKTVDMATNVPMKISSAGKYIFSSFPM